MDQSGLGDIEARRGLKTIGLIVVLLILGLGAFFIYRAFFSSGGGKQEAYTPYTVATMNLRALVTTSGVAVAQNEAVLSFTIPGQIDAIYVGLGDEVKFGQPLMSIKADQLQNAAAAAESGLVAARLRLQKLQEGATDTQKANAALAVVTTQDALTKAQNQLQDNLDAPENAEITAADQAVALAEAALSAAQSKLNTLKDGATDADLAAAEAAVAQAKANLAKTVSARAAASDAKDNARSSFQYYGALYCAIAVDPDSICGGFTSPLTPNQIKDLLDSIEPPLDLALQAAVLSLIEASATYSSALLSLDNAQQAETAARSTLESAEAALDALEDGASDEDIAAAEKGVESAQAALTAAQAARQKLLDGASETTINNLRSTVTLTQVALASASAARDELLAGATQTELDLQGEEVHQAELTVNKARDALEDATLTAPFDGVVSYLPVKTGQSVSSAVPAVTILTPGAILFELNVGETELPDLRVGQTGGLVFDAIPSKAYPIRVVAIGLSPDTQQGVIIYKVKTQITGGLGDPSGPQPAPGMNGSASITTQLKADVVAVPSSVIRSRGTEKVVEVVVDGRVELSPVVTGLTDGENIEIVSGLKAGDIIALRGAAQTGTSDRTTNEDLPGGIR